MGNKKRRTFISKKKAREGNTFRQLHLHNFNLGVRFQKVFCQFSSGGKIRAHFDTQLFNTLLRNFITVYEQSIDGRFKTPKKYIQDNYFWIKNPNFTLHTYFIRVISVQRSWFCRTVSGALHWMASRERNSWSDILLRWWHCGQSRTTSWEVWSFIMTNLKLQKIFRNTNNYNIMLYLLGKYLRYSLGTTFLRKYESDEPHTTQRFSLTCL